MLIIYLLHICLELDRDITISNASFCTTLFGWMSVLIQVGE